MQYLTHLLCTYYHLVPQILSRCIYPYNLTVWAAQHRIWSTVWKSVLVGSDLSSMNYALLGQLPDLSVPPQDNRAIVGMKDLK